MGAQDGTVFQLDRGRAALEKYAAANHLTLQVHGADGRLVVGPLHPTVLFDVFSGSHDPGLFAACVRRCLSVTGPEPTVVVEEAPEGLAVIGTPLVLGEEIVGAAVAGYALTAHLGRREVMRLARDCGLAFDDLWAVVRKELPLPRARLPLRAEVLGILANTLLSEHQRSRQLEETSLRLADAAEAKDRFLAVLSHELRTPLTAILGYAALVRKGTLGEAGVRTAVEVIERNAKLQRQLIDDLLDVSRIISGSLAIRRRPIALAPVVEAAVASVSLAVQAKDIHLAVTHAPSAPMISGDAGRLQQIVSNLLVNAVKFTPRGRRIDVRVEERGPEVAIVVDDTGAGIRPEFLPYVFERFRQDGDTEARSHGGLGLGLAIVRHLVELHGGSVDAASPGEGRGATFTVCLPALERVLAPARSPVGSETAPALAGRRILVVDDDADARTLFTRILEECDAHVKAVPSAATALSALETWKPDVLVSDIGMPDETGYVLMRKIRCLTAEQGGAVPALAVTAYAGAHDVARALSAGFQAHVAKPVEPVELARAVGSLICEAPRGVSTS